MTSLMKTIVFNQRRITANVLRSFSTASEIPKYDTLAVSEPKKHVFHVELNRPKKLNAFNHAMWLEMKHCFESLSENRACRVVVLSAQGKHFTAGIDLNSFMEKASDASEFEEIARKVRFMNKLIRTYQDGITALEKCVKPVITVSHSACVGAGVDLVTAADMRYCTEDCWFQVKEVDIGLAADVGTLQRLPKVIGNSSVARELCYTARKLEAKEALALGLVGKVYKDRDTALTAVLELAETIALKSPVAVQTTKQNLVYSQSRTNDEGLEHIRNLNQAMLLSEDLSKSAVAAISKEQAEFENY
ncbi:delta(3,5)-Delta(2,4)-dienoyl-CoA isomerase, mitochondrial [Choristoneura fumiferana]|uniref:delta(3,5)-Delta(2,4)-dienoyl-CoA isomerase, mitochondrial n=1 Tax=Choristoneura fumiferana TaxID=7141 RepID=UPI003D154378